MKTKEVKSLKEKTAIKCECGYMISGISKAHAKALLKQHRKSELHKKQISINQNIASGAITISGANIIKQKGGVIET